MNYHYQHYFAVNSHLDFPLLYFGFQRHIEKKEVKTPRILAMILLYGLVKLRYLPEKL